MPRPIAPLLAVEYRLLSNNELSEIEQHHQNALVAINHLAAFGRLLSMLSPSRELMQLKDAPAHVIETQSDEIDAAFIVLGELQAAIGDAAYLAVEEMYSGLTSPKSKNK